MELVYVAWLSLAVLVVADVLARRKHPPAEIEPASPSPHALGALAGLSLLLVLVRIPLALGREARGIDEVQYAATAAFVRESGRSLFSWPWNLHGHQVLYLLGSFENPFTAVDVLTSVAVGLTAFLLGWTLLRRGGGTLASLLVPPAYVLGLLRFEGLSSNKEPWVNLFVAGYLFLRLGLAERGRPMLRRLAAGACLGAAVVCKEQALLLVLVEPFLEIVQRLRDEEDPRARSLAFLRTQATAAAGFFIPVGLLLLGFAAHGQLGAYLGFLVDWGSSGGAPLGAFAYTPSIPLDIGEAQPSTLTVLLDGLLPLWMSTVGLLGLAHVLRSLLEPQRLKTTQDELSVALLGLTLAGVVAVSVGLRWSAHYWMLLLPALAPLGVLRLLEALREVRTPAQRLTAGALLALASFTAFQEVYYLSSEVGRRSARGGGLTGSPRETLEQVGAWTAARTAVDQTIFVWGWRPELYFAAGRPPGSRYVGGATAGEREVLEDLRAPGLGLVLKPPPDGWPDDPLASLRDPFDPSRHPELFRVLEERGFIRLAGPESLGGWTAWGPPPR